jgi:cob(I)alamin adenosyltransferase
MHRRKKTQAQRLAQMSNEKGLVIVNTSNRKDKTTAAFWMLIRPLGHGFRVAVVQFIKGSWELAEKEVLSRSPTD